MDPGFCVGVHRIGLAERAARIHAARGEADQWMVGQDRVMRGYCLSKLGRLDEATGELRSAITILEGELGASHWRVDSARARLADVERTRDASSGRPRR